MILLYAGSLDKFFLSLHDDAAVKTAENLAESFDYLLNGNFDAVVVDLAATREDGVDFLKVTSKIRPWYRFVIAVDDECGEEQRQVAEFGYHTFISKNSPPKEFHDLVFREVAGFRQGVNDLDMLTAGEFIKKYEEVIQLTNRIHGGNDIRKMLEKLANGIRKLFPDAMIGIFEEDEDITFQLFSEHPLSKELVSSYQHELVSLYGLLAETSIKPEDIHQTIEVRKIDESGADVIDHEVVIPILDENGITGVFGIALTRKTETEFEKMFMAHTAKYVHDGLEVFQELRNREIHDSLSGLFNHGYMYDMMEKHWHISKRRGEPMGFAIFDIDHFKNINDSYGHRTGDILIKELGALVRKKTKRRDIVSRFGGDEIAIIMPQTNTQGMKAFAERMLEAIRTNEFKESGHPLRITISMGTSSTENPNIKSPTQLLDVSDKAMYLAKRNGRNQACDATELLPDTKVKGEIKETSPDEAPQSRALSIYTEEDKGKILVVDDDFQVIQLLERLLQLCNYEVTTCTDSLKALEMVRAGPDQFDVILSDINMPQMDGLKFTKSVRDIDPNIVVVIITGYASTENTIGAMRAGAYNLIQKPFGLDEVKIIVGRALERRRLKRQLDAYHLGLEELLQERTKALRAAYDELKNAYVKTMEVIVTILDIHEASVALHSQRVSKRSVVLARNMGIIDKDELQTIEYGSLLHDIGKLGIPDSILKKPGKLTPEEMEVMKSHAVMGYKIVKTIPSLEAAAEIVYSHQERFDGKGYPRGLAGHDICTGARIFSIIDTFDALRSDRCYRPKQSMEFTLKEINDCSGTQFDPEIVKVFNNCYDELDQTQVERDTFWETFQEQRDEQTAAIENAKEDS